MLWLCVPSKGKVAIMRVPAAFWDYDTLEALVFTVLFLVGVANWMIYHDRKRELRGRAKMLRGSRKG